MERRQQIELMSAGELYDEAERIARETNRDAPEHYLALILKSLCRSVQNLEGKVDDIDSR